MRGFHELAEKPMVDTEIRPHNNTRNVRGGNNRAVSEQSVHVPVVDILGLALVYISAGTLRRML